MMITVLTRETERERERENENENEKKKTLFIKKPPKDAKRPTNSFRGCCGTLYCV